MARKLTVEIVGDSRSLERTFARAEKSTKSFGQGMSKLGRGALVGSGAFSSLSRSVAFASSTFLGGAGLVAGLKGSVDAASNLAEQTSKANVVFGDSAKAIEAWSKTAVTSMGLASDQALETASSFGALLRPLGLTGGEAAKQSKTLTRLGADLASFYNTSVQDALDAIRSGLVGEVEPLRRYGVLLSETRVQQEALRETGKRHAGNLTQQEKLYARLALILKDTSQAQGDFERTGGGLANQQRILAANVRELQIQIGTALTPSVLEAVRSMNDWLSKSENQQRVLADVKAAAGLLGDVLSNLKNIMDILNDVTGSTRNSLKLLAGAFVAFKALKTASTILGIVGSLGKLTKATETATAAQEGLNAAQAGGGGGKLGKIGKIATLGGLSPGGIALKLGVGAIVATKILSDKFKEAQKEMLDAQTQTFKKNDPLETVLVPRLAKQIEAMKKAGVSTKEILARLREQMGGSPKGDDLIAEAFSFGSGSDPALQARVRRNVRKAAEAAKKVATDEITKVMKGPTVEQRNTWFDALIGRQLDRVQDLSGLRKQLARLKEIAGEVRVRMADTQDVTRRLTLQDKLVGILRQERDLQGQIADAVKAGNKALKDRADAIKSATLAALDQRHQAVENRQRLQDALAALRTAQALGGPQGIKLAERDVSEARFTITRAQLERATARLTRGPGGTQRFALGNTIQITINGATDPEKVAQKVAEIIRRQSRHTSVQSRGPAAGAGY